MISGSEMLHSHVQELHAERPRQRAVGQVQHNVDNERHCRMAIDYENLHSVAHGLVDAEDNALPYSPKNVLGCRTSAAAAPSVLMQEIDVIIQRLGTKAIATEHVGNAQ